MPCPLDDTIAAIASPRGGGARGIVRLSGPSVPLCVQQVFQADPHVDLSAVAAASVISGTIRMGGFAPLPSDLFFWPGRRSYTGQPTAEIHTLGSPPLLDAALGQLLAAGARLAQPGEFTLRAFLAGRLDLTQAEAVLGVIDARDARQLEAALTQLAGGLANPLKALREQLLDLLAHLEAGLDFAEEDLPFLTVDELDGELAAAAASVDRLLRQMASRAESTELVRAVLVGWTNVGKSSLFNVLVDQPEALVFDQPGTTRDYLAAEIDLGDVKCLLVDTAGVELEPGGKEDPIRRAARNAADGQRRQAHVELFCVEATRPPNPWERCRLASPECERILVLTKIDAASQSEPGLPQTAVETSSVTREGIDRLRARLRQAVLTTPASGGEVVSGTAVRCRDSLRLAAAGLKRARGIVETELAEELVAAELRIALDELGKVVGAVYTDGVLDRVFSRFCIGK